MSSSLDAALAWTHEPSFSKLFISIGLQNYLDRETTFDIYVCRDYYHHYIVLGSPDFVGGRSGDKVVLELTKISGYENKQVAPGIRKFTGGSLEFKKTGRSTLGDLAQFGSTVLRRMGKYDLFTSSCQNFCSNFLEEVGAKGYLTDPERVAKGLLRVTGAAVTAFTLEQLFG